MVLPGIQTLFGFQLVAVFNSRFDTALSQAEQVCHLVALLLIGASIALVMTPAAYHRQNGPDGISARLLQVASTAINAALLLLMLGLTLDIYLVARVITGYEAASVAMAVAVLALLTSLWFGFPRWGALRG